MSAKDFDSYRNFNHDGYAQSKDPLDFWGQIRRTVRGQPVSENQINLILTSIGLGLGLEPNDKILDLACGNGALSARFFELCSGLHGVDLSDFLVTTAKSNFEKHPHYTFSQGDLVSFLKNDKSPLTYNKALCYGSFSYLSEDAAIEALLLLNERYLDIEKVFIGNLPDINLHDRFFTEHVPEDCDLTDHTTAIGIWRSQEDFTKIAKSAGWKVRIQLMNESFYSASYRFDAILER